MDYLKYFVGKICSILTEPVNRDFKEEVESLKKPQLYPQNVLDHFTGRVISIDPNCIVTEHPLLKTRAYFRMPKVIGIIEEQEFNPSDPEHAKIIEQYKQQQAEPPSRGKTKCPNGHELFIPLEVVDGSTVQCPVCSASFVLISTLEPPKEEKSISVASGPINLDMMKKLSQEAKKFN